MNQVSARHQTSFRAPRAKRSNRGFSVLELVTVVAVGMILAAISLPLIQSTTRVMRLNAAVNAMAGAIQSTRYRAIFDGCPYNITFSKTANTYQIASESTGGNTCAAAFANVGTAVPFSSTSYVTLDQNLTFQFSPGGSVTATTGTTNFNLTVVGAVNTKNIQVTKYGSITVQ